MYRDNLTNSEGGHLTRIIPVAPYLLTLEEWTFANSGFIIYIFIIDLMIFVCVQFKIGLLAK